MMRSEQMSQHAAPAGAVVVADGAARTIWGVGLQDWVYIATLLYLAFQIVAIMQS